MNKPKVLVIGPLSAVGGMATSMRLQLSSSLGRDYELIAFDNSKRTPADRSLGQGIRAQLGLVWSLVEALKAHRPALVHIHTCSGPTFYRTMLDLGIARHWGARVVLHIRGGRFDEFLDRLSGLRRWLVRRALVEADGVITLGVVWAERLRSFDARIRLTVVHNGVTATEFEPDPCVGEVVRIVLVGTMTARKGIDDLIRAIAQLPQEVRCHIEVRAIGPDPENRMAQLRDLVSQMALERSFVFAGVLSPQAVGEELRKASIFVLPSHAEGMPNALLEAMVRGLPCVVSAVGAVPELIRDGVEGFLIQPGDVKGLAENLRRLIEQPLVRLRMGRAARLRAQRDFGQDRVGDRLGALYRGLLAPLGARA